jgi:hypothetical protein
MWIHIALFILGVQGLCCLQLVLDMNEIMLETAGEALEISDSMSRSFTGAVTPPGKSSSSSDHHHASRGHRRNSTAHQSRSAKSGTYD